MYTTKQNQFNEIVANYKKNHLHFKLSHQKWVLF